MCLMMPLWDCHSCRWWGSIYYQSISKRLGVLLFLCPEHNVTANATDASTMSSSSTPDDLPSFHNLVYLYQAPIFDVILLFSSSPAVPSPQQPRTHSQWRVHWQGVEMIHRILRLKLTRQSFSSYAIIQSRKTKIFPHYR